jgi:chromate reductase, NAD(P)H dehydrogenase (quinone)
MNGKKNILAINGSASSASTNLKLIEIIANMLNKDFNLKIYNDLKLLPHFDPEISTGNPPPEVVEFRNSIQSCDGIIICTPEYVFSIPSGLKNAIEWCISTTVFTYKPIGLITASANGLKGHEELQLIMNTVEGKFTPETTLLIQGIKGKIDQHGNLIDIETLKKLKTFTSSFKNLVNNF